ncbi:hypothetical protein pkur_cds_399 [Pandoravirus kuranda]|uniref:Uncharacterized protein n=1 Tax=Pandoravirus kuranda TaxID=3019033 RepID=A0AA95EIF4_9VIRU|nr:hypothetical protein pkur_cds_399 [Pandoravirus kuranda]
MHTTHTTTISKEKSRTDRMYDYECVIAVELQCAVSWHLVECDPRSALNLAAASRQQAMVLASLLPRLARTCHFLDVAAGATPTAADYVRACVALGGCDPHSAVLMRLLEGLARFLFSSPEWSHWRGIDERYHSAPGPRDAGLCLFPIDNIINDPSLGSARNRAREWYKWFTAGPTECQSRPRPGCLVDTLFLKHTNGRSNGIPWTGRASNLALRARSPRAWIQMGAGPVPAAPNTIQCAVPSACLWLVD